MEKQAKTEMMKQIRERQEEEQLTDEIPENILWN